VRGEGVHVGGRMIVCGVASGISSIRVVTCVWWRWILYLLRDMQCRM
jgi:hypothetical protein